MTKKDTTEGDKATANDQSQLDAMLAELEAKAAEIAEKEKALAIKEAKIEARGEELASLEDRLQSEGEALQDQQAMLADSLRESKVQIESGIDDTDLNIPPEIAVGAKPHATDEQRRRYGEYMRKNYPGRVPYKRYTVEVRRSPKSPSQVVRVKAQGERDAKRVAYKQAGFGVSVEQATAKFLT